MNWPYVNLCWLERESDEQVSYRSFSINWLSLDPPGDGEFIEP
jgi:hypothetical protein